LDPDAEAPTIELDGLRLRSLRESDAAPLEAYLSDPAVTERTSYPVVSRSLVEGMIAKHRQRWAAGELAKWAITRPEDDMIIGTCGFNETSMAHRSAEIAFELGRAYWGRGWMRRIAVAIIDWLYARDVVDRVYAYVRVDNARSARLLESLGFEREACLRSFRLCRGEPHDFGVYGLLRSAWPLSRRA
jgi:ribosomal-protein-alanine N-acetyltransferase